MDKLLHPLIVILGSITNKCGKKLNSMRIFFLLHKIIQWPQAFEEWYKTLMIDGKKHPDSQLKYSVWILRNQLKLKKILKSQFSKMKLFNAVIAAAVASGKRLEIFTGQNLGQTVIRPRIQPRIRLHIWPQAT